MLMPHRMDPTGGCPHAANAALLARGAVARVVLPGEVPAMAVLGHEALKEFIGHPDVAKGAEHFTALREGRIPDGWPLKTFATVRSMTTADGADHRRLRSLVSKAFTARRVEALRPGIERLTEELLDGLAAAAETTTAGALASGAPAGRGGVVDLRAQFALPLPMSVISELLGVDAEFRDRLHVLSTQLVSTDIGPAEAVAANREMVAVLGAVVASRRARPGDDLTSALIAVRAQDAAADPGAETTADPGPGTTADATATLDATDTATVDADTATDTDAGVREGRNADRREDRSDRLSESELIGTLLLMIVAGHETTLNLITNAVRALCAHRDQLDMLLEGRADWADAVEETLRWDSPVSYFPFRYPTRDLTVDGTLIPRGTPVLAGYSAAGRDPSVHGPDADRFDVTGRASSAMTRHLSLGHGAHYCLGAPLARMETTIALRQLFTRFPGLKIAVTEEELPRQRSFVGNGVSGLPVVLG
ncbi:cytochrome P450 family protein [Streptomyces lushanensis]|uniref:cytochrome P450 family protein n=1 Tax=Streptomyces lushanensis TaxID=1434255 RepID=UPI000A5284C7|nr:cytochrome P450 [Streptomyces lushanensis]